LPHDERSADPAGTHARRTLAVELSQRSGKDRAQIARWERDVVQPSLETLRELLRACAWDVELALIPYAPDPKHDSRLRVRLGRTPQERLQGMLRERNR
jgi:transcriptional regulator with XRE-family HTH domain